MKKRGVHQSGPAPAPDRLSGVKTHPALNFAKAGADLAITWVISLAIFIIMTVLIATGVSTLVALGFGVIPLAAALLLVGPIARVGRTRIPSVYGDIIEAPTTRVSIYPGFKGFAHNLWLRFTEAPTWKTLLYVLTNCALTSALIVLVYGGTAWSVAALFSPLYRDQAQAAYWADLPNWGLVLIGIAVLLAALGLLFMYSKVEPALARALLGPSRKLQVQELTEQRDAASAQRSSALNVASQDRSQIERNLHDGVQPRLVSVAMGVDMARTKLAEDPARAAELLDAAHKDATDAITELRQLARGIRPAVLTDRGLDAALSALVASMPMPVTLSISVSSHCSPVSEEAIYYSVAEALTNVAKHAGATNCEVRVVCSGTPGRLSASVFDSGTGGARLSSPTKMNDGARRLGRSGLDGVRDRVEALGGSIALVSPTGGPTTLTVEVPCAS